MPARETARAPLSGATPARVEPAPRAVADLALAALVTVWGLGCLLPIGPWCGVGTRAAYDGEMAMRAWGILIAALLAALLLAVTGGRCGAWLRGALARLLGIACGPYLAGLGVIASVQAVAVAVVCFARNPQLVDTWAQYVQARIFAAGALSAPAPPSQAHFGILQMVTTPDRWFAQYPPLHPALLAAGALLGAPWLVTPLLAALLPAAVYWLGRQGGDERVARLAAALVVLSPFVIAMNASGMNHLPTALCVAAGLALVPALARDQVGAAVAFGALSGVAAGFRPLDAVALAAVGSAALLVPLRRTALRPLAAAALGGGLAVLPTLLFNAATAGSALRFGYTALYGAGHDLGFHAGPWGAALTPLRAVGLTAVDADQLNTFLLEWPLPATVLIVAALAGRRRLDSAGRSAAAYLVALVALLFFYFHRDLLYGPRLLFSAVPAVLVLVAAGILRLGAFARPLPRLGAAVGDALVLGIAVLALQGAVWLAPQRLASYSVAGSVLALHPDDDARRAGLHHAVVVLRDGWGTRLITGMWDAGVPVALTARLYAALDACALETLLRQAAAEGVRGPALVERLQAAAASADPGRYAPGATRDPLLRLPAGGRLTPGCAAAIAWDREGTMQYAAVAHLNAPGLDGDLVWARELPDLSVLRRLYPDRPIYRYAWSGPGAQPTFTRID